MMIKSTFNNIKELHTYVLKLDFKSPIELVFLMFSEILYYILQNNMKKIFHQLSCEWSYLENMEFISSCASSPANMQLLCKSSAQGWITKSLQIHLLVPVYYFFLSGFHLYMRKYFSVFVTPISPLRENYLITRNVPHYFISFWLRSPTAACTMSQVLY